MVLKVGAVVAMEALVLWKSSEALEAVEALVLCKPLEALEVHGGPWKLPMRTNRKNHRKKYWNKYSHFWVIYGGNVFKKQV